MLAQKNELQLICLEREGCAHLKMERKASIKSRRRKRRIRRRICFGLMVICAALLAAACLKLNWFANLQAAGADEGQAKRLWEEIAGKEDEYPAELAELLEQNEETQDFVEDYPERRSYIGGAIDLSGEIRGDDVPLLMQWDKRWGYDLYGDSMIGIAGCGPTCMTMAYLYHTKDAEMNPRKMAEFAQDGGYHTTEGTSWDFWITGALELGLYGEQISLNENTMKSVLDCGGVVVCSMAPGDFTTKGHFILLRGYDENGFFVNDPNRKSNSEKQWDFETLSSQIKNLWGIYKA